MSVRPVFEGKTDILLLTFIKDCHMDRLNRDWLSTGVIDFEYQRYVLLGYIKHIRKEFLNVHLYPSLSDIIQHYRNLIEVKENKRVISENFPKAISEVDFRKWSIKYKTLDEDSLIDELESIISYAIPLFTEVMEEGRELYDFVEGNMELQPVGIVPMYLDEGYMMMTIADSNEVNVYRYQVSVFEGANEKYRGVNVEFLTREYVSIGRTLETVKADLVKYEKTLPNPATFVIINKLNLPEAPTILPIAKRLLIKTVTAA